MSKTICDKCKKEFKVRPRTARQNDIERVYIKCPKCKAEYTAYYTDSSIRAKQQIMRDMRDDYARTKAPAERIRLLNMMNSLKQEIGRDMDELKTKVEKREVKVWDGLNRDI